MNQLKILLFILFVNVLIAMIYFVIKCYKKEWKKGLIMGGFMLLCPVTAPCYLFFSELIYKVFLKNKENEFSVDELSFRKDKIEIIRPADLKGGINKVPIEDALLVSDKQNARRVMLDVLKDGYAPFLEVIAKAVEHDDSEVSHYAASAISDVIAEFKNNEKEIRKRYESEKEYSKELAVSYADYLYDFLVQHILPKAEQQRYVKRYIWLMNSMYEKKEIQFVEENCLKLMGFLLEEEDFENAKIWVDRVSAQSIEELNVYKALLKYYYTTEDKKLFFETLDTLKKSDIVLDGETLDQIRFWNN